MSPGLDIGYKVIGSLTPIVYKVSLNLDRPEEITILFGAAAYQNALRIGTESMHKQGGMIRLDILYPEYNNNTFLVIRDGSAVIITYLEYRDGNLFIHSSKNYNNYLPDDYRVDFAEKYPDRYKRQLFLTEVELAMIQKMVTQESKEYEKDPESYAKLWL